MIRLLEWRTKKPGEIKLYDIVNYAGHTWYVIGLDGDTLTLLGYYWDFGKHIFDKDSNDYKTSEIRKYLKTKILPELINNGANPLPTNLPDTGVTGDKIWLLSADEADKLPVAVRKFFESWWLRSGGDRDDFAIDVGIDGGVGSIGYYVDINHAIRPVMRVKLEDFFELDTFSPQGVR